ncbi:LCP family protein [Janibacter sp. G56]|uniref:LCP family protein n=1 Tax=Janibacter sp. G56 TaxID=3418717 RepID=UPI003D03C8F5
MGTHDDTHHGRHVAAEVTKQFLTRTTASTVIPGLGLIPTRRRAGLLLTGAAVLGGLSVLAYALSQGAMSSALALGLSPRRLFALLVAIVVGAAAWIVGIALTARDNLPDEGRVTERRRWWLKGFAVLAALAVAIPATQAFRYATIQRSVLDTVFDAARPEGATAPKAGDDPWAGVDQVNVLLIGSDAGADRVGVRPDSMMVASVDPAAGDTVLFGIPRNLEMVPIPESNPLHALWPDGYNCGDQCLINGVWTLATDHPDLFPGDANPGLTTTRDVVGAVLGLDLDYTVVIDLKGFTALVDAMGGVDINVTERVCIGCHTEGGVVVGTTGYIEPGFQHLDGYHALWYARSRAESTDGDFSRMRRQRCVIGALLNQVDPIQMLRRYPALASVLKDSVSIDIPRDDLQAWADLTERVQGGTIRSLPLTNKVIDVGNPDYDAIHVLVQDAIAPQPASSSSSSTTPSSTTTSPTSPSTTTSPAPSESPTTQEGLEDLAATC